MHLLRDCWTPERVQPLEQIEASLMGWLTFDDLNMPERRSDARDRLTAALSAEG